MAIYTATLFQSSVLGGNPAISVKPSSSLNNLVKSVGEVPLIIGSLDLWTDNPDQIREPISFINNNPDGKGKSIVDVPQLDPYQKDISIKCRKVSGAKFDNNTSFGYKILPNSKVKMTLNFAKTGAGVISNAQRILEAVGMKEDNIKKDVLGDMDLRGSMDPIDNCGPSPFKEKEEKKVKIPKLKPKKKASPKKVLTKDDIKNKIKATEVDATAITASIAITVVTQVFRKVIFKI